MKGLLIVLLIYSLVLYLHVVVLLQSFFFGTRTTLPISLVLNGSGLYTAKEVNELVENLGKFTTPLDENQC